MHHKKNTDKEKRALARASKKFFNNYLNGWVKYAHSFGASAMNLALEDALEGYMDSPYASDRHKRTMVMFAIRECQCLLRMIEFKTDVRKMYEFNQDKGLVNDQRLKKTFGFYKNTKEIIGPLGMVVEPGDVWTRVKDRIILNNLSVEIDLPFKESDFERIF